MAVQEPISVFLERMLPDYMFREYPNLVAFMRTMLEYLEENQFKDLALMDDYADIDNTLDEFLIDFQKEYGEKIPRRLYSDIRFFLKNIRSLYRSKGTEDSYRFLFRTVYDTEVSFYYPSVDILRLSDGVWISPLRIIPEDQDNAEDWVGSFIIGIDSGAEGFIEELVTVTQNEEEKDAFNMSNVNGEFTEGERITIEDTSTNTYIDEIRSGDSRWLDDRGFLSWNKYLQDNYYYQDFSYVLRSEVGVNIYRNLVQRLLHPAGFLMFGEIHDVEMETMELETMTAKMLPFLIEWINHKEQIITLKTSIFYSFFEGVFSSEDVMYDYRISFKYFESHREDPYYNRVWTIEDLEHLSIDEFDV